MKEQILESRAKLISALEYACDCASLYEYKEIMASVVSGLKDDKYSHFVSIDLDDLSRITYATNNKHVYETSKRTKTTLARYIRRQFDVSDETFPDKFLTKLSTIVNKKIQDIEYLNTQVKVLHGMDVVEYYRTTGSKTSHSCMTGPDSKKTMMYGLNPDNVGLVVSKNGGRALLWTSDCGKKILDRVYPSCSKEGELIRNWAERKGFDMRSIADSVVDDRNTVKTVLDGNYIVTLKHDDTFPYMDTFPFGNMPSGNTVMISNKREMVKNPSEKGACQIMLRHTDGSCSVIIDCCLCSYFTTATLGTEHKHIGMDGKSYCQNCFNTKYFFCTNCKCVEEKTNGFKALDNIYCKKCFDKMSKNCEECQASIFSVVIINGKIFCNDCAAKYKICKSCQDWYLKTELVDGCCCDCQKEESMCTNTSEHNNDNRHEESEYWFVRKQGLIISGRWFCSENCMTHIPGYCCLECSRFRCDFCGRYHLVDSVKSMKLNTRTCCENCHAIMTK